MVFLCGKFGRVDAIKVDEDAWVVTHPSPCYMNSLDTGPRQALLPAGLDLTTRERKPVNRCAYR